MDREELARRLMVTFLGELDEHVRGLERDLVALERAADPAATSTLLAGLFRAAHSLKGAARSVDVGPIEAACHQLEEVFAAAREGVVALTPDRVEVLLAAVDAIADAAARLRSGATLEGSPLAQILPRLRAAATAAGTVARTSRPPPRASSPPPPVVIPAPSPKPAALPPPAPRAPAGERDDAVVRVAAARLDALVARSGELVVAQRRLELRCEELVAAREELARWQEEWARCPDGALRRAAQATAAPGEDVRVPPRLARLAGATPERLKRLAGALERVEAALAQDRRALGQAAAQLDGDVRRLRMVPFVEACEGLDRAARDLARAAGKRVAFGVDGGGVALDRSVAQALRDPLLQLVRNAVVHGIEAPEARRAAGKPLDGRVRVAVTLRGALVEVAVEDDGRGIDLAAVREAVRARGAPEPRDDRELARAVFLPGLSTAAAVTEVSGRGVGLDVVASRLAALHGSVDVSSTPGRGARFVLTAPLTLGTARALLVTAGGQTFACIGTSVRALLRAAPDDVRTVEGREVLALGGALVALFSLAAVLGVGAREAARDRARAQVVVLAAGDRQAAFVVDELLAEQEVTITGLGARLARVRHVAGATILPTGRVALVLSAAGLLATALGRREDGAGAGPALGTAGRARRRVLVVDDSVTTRTLERTLLEGAGYDVVAAADGAEAWERLQEGGVDIVVADVEMPRMDGFALTAAVRADPRLAALPVVLVTALESERDRARGVEVGADAYLAKGGFDPRGLLDAVARLL